MSDTPCSIVSHLSPVRRSRRFTSEDARRPAAASASACCAATAHGSWSELLSFLLFSFFHVGSQGEC